MLVDGDTTVVVSCRIAEYLESSYPNAPSFFRSKEGTKQFASGLPVREQKCRPSSWFETCLKRLYLLNQLYSCNVGKGGVKFIVHWLDHAIYPVLMQILCADALEVAHEWTRPFFAISESMFMAWLLSRFEFLWHGMVRCFQSCGLECNWLGLCNEPNINPMHIILLSCIVAEYDLAWLTSCAQDWGPTRGSCTLLIIT